MACEHCVDPDGVCCFPMYGVGPHKHVGVTTESGSWIGSTMELPKTDWPANYEEDPDCPGLGTWWCPHCGDGKPFNLVLNGDDLDKAIDAAIAKGTA